MSEAEAIAFRILSRHGTRLSSDDLEDVLSAAEVRGDRVAIAAYRQVKEQRLSAFVEAALRIGEQAKKGDG